jgi:putative FmdB family regulatory protein
MPFYVYKCPSCGHGEESLQHRDAPAPACPSCATSLWQGEPRHVVMEKQLTTAGFEIKGLLR